ncbi:MAG TPA: DMT family transporter, partial [Phototrophicaceae bacterium]|nr:DMT family transporter [Phototrophicaceae bacterium]
MNSTQRQGVILIVLAAAGYAMLPIFAKWAYAAGLKPLDVVTWRFVFATPVIWLLTLRFSKSTNHGSDQTTSETTTKLPYLKLLAMGGIFGIAAMMAFFSLDRIPASTYIVLAYLYPAFVAIFSIFNGEYLSSLGWIALGITIFGVALTVPDFATGFSNSDPIGLLLGVLNGFGYSIYIVLSSRLLRGQTALAQASALSITGSLIVLLFVALFITGLNVPPDLNTWLVIVGVAMTSSVLPIFAFYAGMQRLGAPQAAILSTIEPILVVLLSTLLLGERMLPIQVV